jgi:hypothetical protein
MVETLEHFKRYPQLVWTLLNIHSHMKNEKYDYPLIICGGTGNGKALSNNTKIMTPENYKFIKDIKVGDYVIGSE